MTLIALIRDEDSLSRANAARTLLSFDLEVLEEDLYIGDASPSRPASERPTLQKAMGRLWPHDLLVVFDLVALGNSPADVLCTLREIKNKGASVVCICAEKDGFAVARDDVPIPTLGLVVELDTKVRQRRAYEAAQVLKQHGARMGRPGSFDAESQRRVLDALAAGRTVTEVARAMNTSRQTIMRIRASRNSGKGADGHGVDGSSRCKRNVIRKDDIDKPRFRSLSAPGRSLHWPSCSLDPTRSDRQCLTFNERSSAFDRRRNMPIDYWQTAPVRRAMSFRRLPPERGQKQRTCGRSS